MKDASGKLNGESPSGVRPSRTAWLARLRALGGQLWVGGRGSVTTRLILAFIFITLLGAGASSAGLWFTSAAVGSVQTVQETSQQIQTVSELQKAWLLTVGSVDSLLQTRSITSGSSGIESLARNVASFKTQLEQLNAALELSPSAAPGAGGLAGEDTSKEYLAEVQRIAAEMDAILAEFESLAKAGRWGSALTLRQTALASLQDELEKNLDGLSQTIQTQADASITAANNAQSLARLVWIAATLLTLGLSVLIGWNASRSIALPINQLKSDIERYRAGISPGGAGQSAASAEYPGAGAQAGLPGRGRAFAALERQDEIGDLSRAFTTLADWLNDTYTTLEKRVTERTLDLERRARQVQAAAEVARDITLASGARAAGGSQAPEYSRASEGAQGLQPRQASEILAETLHSAVNLIRDRFGYYHAGVFLTDERREYAVLRAATGEAGAKMLENRHRLKVGEVGLVGNVTGTGQARIALDVGKDAVHFRNPLLPETRSEVALPLRVGAEVIGALDVQSKESAAFDAQDIVVLQIIADQIATAIENARLVAELQGKLGELEKFYAEYGRQSWMGLVTRKNIVGYEYDGASLKPLLKQAAGAAEPVRAGEVLRDPVSFPLKLRGEAIGALEVWPAGEDLSQDEKFILEALSGRIIQVLESARLFDEAQSRAAREQLLNRLTASIVRSLDPEGVLQAAAQEIGQIPSIREATIYLGSPDPRSLDPRSVDPQSPETADQAQEPGGAG